MVCKISEKEHWGKMVVQGYERLVRTDIFWSKYHKYHTCDITNLVHFYYIFGLLFVNSGNKKSTDV